MKKFKPLHDWILLESIEEEKKKGGIILPETVKKDRPMQGKVLAVGPGKIVDGKLIPTSVKKGSIVWFTKYSPTEITMDGKEYLVIKEEHILGLEE